MLLVRILTLFDQILGISNKVREQLIKVNKTGATFLSVSKFSRVERGGSIKNISENSYTWLDRWSTDLPDWIRDCIQKIEEF